MDGHWYICIDECLNGLNGLMEGYIVFIRIIEGVDVSRN